MWVTTRLRLVKSAPELSKPEGRAAKTEATKRWPRGKHIRFSVRWVDDYGRIVADIL
jgi:endonuclease YncB( thermonuclease family)